MIGSGGAMAKSAQGLVDSARETALPMMRFAEHDAEILRAIILEANRRLLFYGFDRYLSTLSLRVLDQIMMWSMDGGC
jgi:hypothetical protein